MNTKIIFLTLALLWTIIIFIGCSLPGRDMPSVKLFDHFDKVVHFTFFFVFFVLWYQSSGSFFAKSMVLIFLSFLYGFGLEFYQIHFVQGRSFDVWDGIADTIGAIVGSIFIFFKKSKSHY
ncbi:MAG: VanZ family protein [Chitinophagaceae bacterium]